ncbi:allophanate hydrolase [Erythrobacter sp. SG61-1L]|uniref:allophanate hydrolase n=1 Tax=Erythrobacter sp. SG61-1L TaxID=1603897 RepID=UPI0006C9085C|nr:allophanate hydrolase [Erythrobacter sp. SG61-1L]KPL66870.1 allophanate hydrolase [Erythrobacter sp. SG61-1L]
MSERIGPFGSIGVILSAVRSGESSAVKIAQDALARADAYEAVQPQVWISRVPAADVLAAAAEVDRRIAAGEDLPLAGVPFAAKDNLDVAGMVTTAACPSAGYVPERSARVVELLQVAGAVLIGKTNLDQFATGLVGTRSPYGACGCVFDKAFVSGGSSSGSAVSVAAGVVAFALGTDTAGSGRVPAAFNGLVGLKPTKGRWSTRGLLPACRSLDCVSVFAHSLEDARAVDAVLTSFDEEDIYSREAGAFAAPEKPRIGIPRKEDLHFLGDEDSAAFYAEAARHAATLGEVAEVDISQLLDCAQLLYSGPWVAERTAALKDLLETNPKAIHPVVRGIVQSGVSKSAVDAFEGQYALKHYERAAQAIWRAVDLLVLPTTPTIYTKDQLLADPVALNSNLGLYTNFVNLLDMSALAIPAGFRANGTGFGITLMGPAWADGFLLDFASAFQENQTMSATPPLDETPHKADIHLAVVGAHLHGMPLHFQLEERNARLVRKAKTAPAYRLYAMETTPPKPALIHVGEADGSALELEIYEMDYASFGSFVEEVPAPLAIGTVTLDDGSEVKGFVAEPRAMEGSKDVTSFGGWRAYIASLKG